MYEDEIRAAVRGPAEVSAQVAYQAAEERLVRTTRALVLAEAQVQHWKELYVRAMGQLNAADESHWRPTGAGPAEFVCPYWGGEDGQDQGAAGGTEPERAVDRPQAVPQ